MSQSRQVWRFMSSAANAARSPRVVRVSASYQCRGVDISALHQRMAVEWPRAELILDRDWVTAIVPEPVYTGEADDDDSSHPVYLSVSRRGSTVAVNVPAGEPYHRRSTYNPHSLIPTVPHTPLPLGAAPASEEMRVQLDTSRPLPSTSSSVAGSSSAAQSGDNEGVAPSGTESSSNNTINNSSKPRFRSGALEMRARDLDIDAVRVLNSCMAQTVNLQFFEGQVEGMYDTVQQVHEAVERGALTSNSLLAQASEALGASLTFAQQPLARGQLSASALYRHLAAVNEISNQVVLSGLKNTVRPGSTAWKEERFSELQEVLWDEFDLQERYEELTRKLTYVQETIRYSLDVARDAKAIFLERLIVLLIAAELALSLAGTGVFGHAASAAAGVMEKLA